MGQDPRKRLHGKTFKDPFASNMAPFADSLKASDEAGNEIEAERLEI